MKSLVWTIWSFICCFVMFHYGLLEELCCILWSLLPFLKCQSLKGNFKMAENFFWTVGKNQGICFPFFKATCQNGLSNMLNILNDFTVSDKHSVEKFVTEVLSGLKLIDKSSHKGIHKVWILQNMLIPRLRWPLLIYEISISVVNCIEHKISSLLRKILQLTLSLCLWRV